LEENYGQKDRAKEAKIKELYNELKLEEVFQKYEAGIFEEIKGKIAQIDESEGLKKSVFEEFLRKIYKRSK
jgi:farnesyl diphosphate synthase